MSERSGIATAPRPAVAWPPDDTEESVLGTNLHQEAIRNLCAGLNEVAASLVPPDRQQPWHAYGQTAIMDWRRPDGSAYTTLPDVYVYRQVLDLRRPSLSLADDGPPLLVVEVLSPATYVSDLDLERGKGYSYARGGVREYLTLDATGEFAGYRPEQGRAWRLEDGRYRPWRPDRLGRWVSEELGSAIAMEGAMVAVYGPDGRRQLREGEVNRILASELARREAEHAARERAETELAQLRAEMERLRWEHDLDR